MLWLRIIIIGTLALLSLGATAEEKEKCGPYDGVDLTDKSELLEKILSAHADWLADSERRLSDPRRANLCRADLSRAVVPGIDLRGADLESADLGKAHLFRAHLSEADLERAILSGAELAGADLRGADLERADLSKAHLFKADLRVADLTGANLRGADLTGADLRGADLTGANLSKAHLFNADLSKADLESADLGMARLLRADPRVTDLTDTDLRDSDLTGANLSKAKLLRTDLTNSRVTDTSFSATRYEPSSAPSKGYLGGIQGLRDVWFEKGEQGGLVLLRAALKEAGLRQLEREATYAIERGKTSYAPPLERWSKLILFEWTSDYGLDYGRPLLILLALLFPFAAVYSFSLAGRGTSRIYRVWSDERIEDDKPEGNPVRSTKPLVFDPFKDDLRIVGFALYFSLLSAVHIGWRDLNVGNWIARVQPREYTLRAKGWVRTVSGIQSLISIYLLALWVLVYFGRPFG